MKKIDYMKLNTCTRCGRLYETFVEGNHCPECYAKLEERLDNVRTFINAHKEANLEEVAIALKVERKQLLSWIRDSRLKFDEVAGVSVPCLKCGKEIPWGKYCNICRHEMMSELESVYEDKKVRIKGRLNETENVRMRFLNRDRKK